MLIAIWMFINSQKRNRRRDEAGHLRQHAAGGEPLAESRETAAREVQQEAEVAREQADQAEQEARAREEAARAATAEAREQRDRVTDAYVEADEIDPDTKR